MEVLGDGHYVMIVGGETLHVTAGLADSGDKTRLTCNINGVKTSANIVQHGDSLHVFTAVSKLIARYYRSRNQVWD